MQTLKGLERILGRKLETLAMATYTVKSKEFDLTVRSAEYDSEAPHVHILSYSLEGKHSNRMKGGDDVGKVMLDFIQEYTEKDIDIQDIRDEEGHKIEYTENDRTRLDSYKKEICNILNRKVEAKKSSYKDQKNWAKFIDVYIHNYSDCPLAEEFREYLDEVEEETIGKKLGKDNIADKLINELIEKVKTHKIIKPNDFKKDLDGNILRVNVKNLGIWVENKNKIMVPSENTWKSITEVIEKLMKITDAKITPYSNGEYLLSFDIEKNIT